MPEQLKNAPQSPQFQKYLTSFIKRKERAHRRKVMREVLSSVGLMIAS